MPRFVRSFFYLALLLVGGWMLSSPIAFAAPQINNQINYQARLMDASGFPVADGNYSIIFSLYDESTAGNRIWTAAGTLGTPTALTVNVQNGLFTILLGDTGQNTLDTVNWNSDQLYLGVTINADSEMAPRKRFASAPQAFNARQLQGMYASSTASGGQSLFTINQTENNAATGTRTALEVRSNGTSNSNDFLVRGVNDLGATVFSINREGSVTSTNSFSVFASSTSLNANIATFATATVAGQGICLSDGSFCNTSFTETDTLQSVTDRGNLTTNAITAANLLSTGITSSTRYFADDGSFSSPAYSFTGSQNSGMFMSGGNLAFSRAGTSMIIATASGVSINFGLFPIAPGLQDIGSSGLEWRNALFSGTVTSTAIYAATGTFTGALTVTGQNVCLANGTNCQTASSTDLNWTFNLAGDFVHNATATTDVVIGSSTQAGAPFVFLNNTTTSRLLVGQNSSTGAGADLVIGATTSSGMNSLFQLTGDDLFVAGNIGSASSVYTNGAFVAGPGSTLFGDGFITKTNGDLTLSASGSFVVTTSTSFLNNIGFGTSTPITQLHVPGRVPTTASGSVATDAVPYQIVVQGRYAYVVSAAPSNSLEIFDVSNPSVPVSIGSVAVDTDALSVYVQGGYAYVVSNAGSLQVIDVSNPSAPVVVSTVSIGGAGRFVYVQGHFAYVLEDGVGFLQVYDVSNPSSPTRVGNVVTGGFPRAISVQGRYAYVANTLTNTLEVFDVSDPTTPISVSATATGAFPTSVYVQGRYAYVTGGVDNNLQIIDVSNPALLVVVGTVATGDSPFAVYVQGRYAYVANSTDTNLQFIDVSDPTAPVSIGTVTTDADPRSLYVQGRYAYVMNFTGATIQAFDLGGAYIQQLEVGGLEAGTLTIRNTLQGVDASFLGGLSVARSANISGGLSVTASSTSSTVSFMNLSGGTTGTNWGAYIDQLTVGSNIAATGTNNYSMVITYASSATFGGLCIDDTSTGATCPTNVGASLLSDGAVISNAFDLAEMYSVTGTTEAGDVLVLDASSTATVMRSSGIAYDSKVIGIVSTDPGFVLGWSGGAKVALTGRVPVKVSMNNGPIAVGDALVSADVAGYAMKATQPGMILGYALESASATGTAQVFVSVGFWAGLAFSPTGQIQVDDSGNVSIMNDLHVGGRLFPSLKGGGIQNDWFLFVNADDPTSTYISTNAAGFMSMDSYDFAERYYSPDELEPGDLVVVSDNGRTHVQRSLNEDDMLLGIVSTRPAFIAGRPATSTYPIALSGRVPTKVSNMNGAIKAGDPLAPTTIPGVAAKAVRSGPIIGLALEDFAGANIEKIEVFVNPGYWVNEGEASVQTIAPVVSSQIVVSQGKQGFATIVAGSKKVRIEFPSLGAYPNVQVTPRGSTKAGWWTDSYTDTGFEIILSEAEDHDVVFAWRVEATTASDIMRMSDGTYAPVDPITGLPTGLMAPTTTVDIIEEPTPEIAPEPDASTSTEPIPDPVPSEPDSTSTSTVQE